MAVNWKVAKLSAEALGIGGTFLIALLTLVANRASQKDIQRIQERQQEIQVRQAQASLDLDQLKQMNEYNLNVYKEVVQALKDDKAERLQSAVTALVEAMPAESPLRDSLLRAIAAGATSPEVKDAATFAVEQPAPKATPPSDTATWQSWDVDVFYCANEPEGEKRAYEVAQELRAHPPLGTHMVGTVRFRKIPDGVNRRAGYRVTGLQLRHEASERDAALRLKETVSPRLKQFYGAGADVQLYQSVSRTPGYLSLFLCAGKSSQPPLPPPGPSPME